MGLRYKYKIDNTELLQLKYAINQKYGRKWARFWDKFGQPTERGKSILRGSSKLTPESAFYLHNALEFDTRANFLRKVYRHWENLSAHDLPKSLEEVVADPLDPRLSELFQSRVDAVAEVYTASNPTQRSGIVEQLDSICARVKQDKPLQGGIAGDYRLNKSESDFISELIRVKYGPVLKYVWDMIGVERIKMFRILHGHQKVTPKIAYILHQATDFNPSVEFLRQIYDNWEGLPRATVKMPENVSERESGLFESSIGELSKVYFTIPSREKKEILDALRLIIEKKS